MSYDRQLDQLCPHMVIEEALPFADDRQTVRPLRPIAAISSVKLRIDGAIEVPSPGTHLPAQATGLKSGPFNVQGGSTDKLVLKVNEGSYQTLTVPSGTQISPEQIVNKLNLQIQEAAFSVTARKQIRLTTSNVGTKSTLFLAATGSTAANVLGLQTDRGWRGRTTYPGWTIVNDPNTLFDRPTRLVLFDEPLKGFNDWIELNYSTVRQECRRCGGLGVENDWRYDGRGNLLTVQGENLLMQELVKATYTVQGSNSFHPWYGTHIVNTIGKKLSSSGVIQNMITADIYEAFRRWQSVKKQQEEAAGQFVSDEEFPFRLLSVSLQQSEQDPTVIFVNATVQNRSDKPIQLDRGLRLPLPLDLLGSTQQEALLAQNLPDYRLVK
jgi:hypothetical protein